jgi:hypothetical protein
VKLTIDCVLTAELSSLQGESALAQLLAKAQVTQLAMPLEALICEQYGLQVAADYPIAAIAAAADGLDVGDAYWLRADAVHLVLQRDCFSLGEPVPLQVTREHAERMIASLNQHFSQDGLMFVIGNSGDWYLRSAQSPQITTTLPSVAVGKNIHPFMPQGLASSKWLAVLNEVQMLLFEHPANAAREVAGELVVNSIWLSGGGLMPQTKALQNDIDLMVANSVLHQGLAAFSATPCVNLPTDLAGILQNTAQHVRLQLPAINNLAQDWFNPLLVALKNKKISHLTLNFGFYEQSLTLEITSLDLYKFWRKIKPVTYYLKIRH